MDELTDYQSPGTLSLSNIQNCHPLDLLWNINPEVTGLVYANREKWLTTEFAPYLAMFRKCQADEKIAIVRSIVDKCAIDADERQTALIAQTRERISRLETEGAITQESIRAKALVDVQQIASQSELQTQITKSEYALQLQKLKYDAAKLFLEKNSEVHKYLSDNELKAERIAAGALHSMIVSAEQIRADAQNKATAASLDGKMKVAEFEYLARLKESEDVRNGMVTAEHTHAEAQKYISDNRTNAARIRAETQRDMVLSTEHIRASAKHKAAEASLVERVTAAKLGLRARLREIETEQQNTEHASYVAITQAYLLAQASIARAAFGVEIAKAHANGLVEQEDYRTLATAIQEGMGVLKARKAKKVTIKGKTKYSTIEVQIDAEYEK